MTSGGCEVNAGETWERGYGEVVSTVSCCFSIINVGFFGGSMSKLKLKIAQFPLNRIVGEKG